MKSIMLSIKPQWVEKIINKEKTIEIRKSKPSCELPCKIYIYCTKNNGKWIGQYPFYKLCDKKLNDLNGKVVAEFILYDVETIDRDYNDWLPKRMYDIMPSQLEASCLTEEQLDNYLKGQTGYAWHIDDLKIYDKPKELSEFRKDLDCDDYPCNKGGKNSDCEYYYYDTTECCSACGIDFDGEHCIYKTIKRPPQSWCYVEKVVEDE